MTIQISVSNRQKMGYLVELLKSLDFVEQINVEEDKPETTSKPSAFFAKHNGSIPNLDVKEFEDYLAKTRNEWE